MSPGWLFCFHPPTSSPAFLKGGSVSFPVTIPLLQRPPPLCLCCYGPGGATNSPDQDHRKGEQPVASTSLARSGREPKTRLEKGWAIYSEHATEIIASYNKGVWLIPSQSNGTSVYEVCLGRHHGADCECPDFQYREGERCRHTVAAEYAAANSEHCAFCRGRFAYGELEPIDGDHYLGLACRKCGA